MQTNKQTFNDYLNLVIFAKIPYKVTLSNFTQKIESEFINFQNISKPKSKMFFLASNLIKKQVTQKPLPPINKVDLNFYNLFIKTDISEKNIYGIDLKSAYMLVMYKYGFIDLKTFNFVNKLKKIDRLQCLGMLASQKNESYFDNENNLLEFKELKKETENYFYFAVSEVEKIMSNLQKLLLSKNDYLFTWVDCIYFKNEANFDPLMQFLEDNNFQFHKKIYSKFEAKKINEKTIKITMFETDVKTNKEKIKLFHIPTYNYKLKNELSKLILKNNL